MDEERFHRQILLFGKEGQARIEATKIAIVGLGGTGSHVAQQLAYLGVRAFALIDLDRASKSNQNRLIGAVEAHTRSKRRKVFIARRMIHAITPGAAVTVVPKSFISEEGFAALSAADFVFGCMDRDGARLILTEYCVAYEKPYLDIATDIVLGNLANPATGQVANYGGRLIFSRPGVRCLSCTSGVLDREAIRDDLSSGLQREEDGRIYGVPRNALITTGPSVVSLNGVLASLAVTEFMVEVTGLRPARDHLQYHGRSGKVTLDTTPPEADCPYCRSMRGIRDRADILRYVRQGLGNRL